MRRILIAALLFMMLAGQDLAEQRYALLIGNEDYPASVGPLNNPHEDVARIKDALIAAGFPAANIQVVNDATQSEINLAVAGFSSKLKKAGNEGIGFFYYSGHGGSAEASGVRANYLIPAKTPLTGSEQLPILGVPMSGLIDSLAAANAKAVFVVSDACRNTLPFTSTKGGATDKGMVRVVKRSGLFIAYATADGATAPDDGSFSRALATRLKQKGLTADRAFTLAFREVAKRRPGNALPFSTDGLTSDIYLAGRAIVPKPLVVLPDDESQALGIAISSGDLDKLHAFQRQFPNSKSIDLVNRYVGELTTERAKASAVPMFMTAGDSPIVTPEPSNEVSPNCVIDTGPYITFFDWQESAITPEAATILDSLVAHLRSVKSCGRFPINISSYYSLRKIDEENIGYAERRAIVVKEYLKGRLGSDFNLPIITSSNAAHGGLASRRVEVTLGPE